MADSKPQAQTCVMFVDDDINVLKALHRVVRGKPWQVFLAEGGEHGLGILAKNKI